MDKPPITPVSPYEISMEPMPNVRENLDSLENKEFETEHDETQIVDLDSILIEGSLGIFTQFAGPIEDYEQALSTAQELERWTTDLVRNLENRHFDKAEHSYTKIQYCSNLLAGNELGEADE